MPSADHAEFTRADVVEYREHMTQGRVKGKRLLSGRSWRRLVRNDIHAAPVNFSGSATLSVPCGFSTDGLPLGVQFVGRRLSESVLCRTGHAYEQAIQWHSKHPAI